MQSQSLRSYTKIFTRPQISRPTHPNPQVPGSSEMTAGGMPSHPLLEGHKKVDPAPTARATAWQGGQGSHRLAIIGLPGLPCFLAQYSMCPLQTEGRGQNSLVCVAPRGRMICLSGAPDTSGWCHQGGMESKQGGVSSKAPIKGHCPM